jgi:hypothetical protein
MIAGVLGVGAVSLATGAFDDEGGSHPAGWDPRVLPLVRFVERERGLDFDHPVYVDFLSAEEYSTQSTSGESELSKDDRASLDRLAGELRAFGLASGKLDLLAAYNQVTDSGTLAFYDPADRRVRVRGADLTVGVEVTLVHELTHALQDQHFDLAKLLDDADDDGASVARRGLAEGDALRVEDAYISDQLSDDEEAAYDEEYAGELESSEAGTDGVPSFLLAGFGVPYALGQPFATMLYDQGGNRAVDAAFRKPPTTEEHLFDPVSYLAHEKAEPTANGLAKRIETTEDGTFGSPSWYLLLADRIDPKTALSATLGWAGDTYATYERDGRTCVRAVFQGDGARDDEEMRDALGLWAADLPAGLETHVELLDVKGHPAIDACDPGDDVDVLGADRADETLVVPAVHAYLEADAATVLDPAETRCYAATVIAQVSYDQLLDPDGAVFQDEAFQQLAEDAVERCQGA